MIRFEQGETGTPRDIIVITDDSDAELAEMTEAFDECAWTDSQSYANLGAAVSGEDGLYRFTIPGDEAGDVAEVFEGVVPLDQFIEDIHRKLMDEAGD